MNHVAAGDHHPALADENRTMNPRRRTFTLITTFAHRARRRSNQSAEHVLIVDDEPVVRALTARMLAEAGFTTTLAADGREALAAVQNDPRAFDAVVSDVVMPGLDGVALLKRLADMRPSLPVLLISGYAPPELDRFGILTPCAVLPKPFEPYKLVQAVRACIDGEAAGTG